MSSHKFEENIPLSGAYEDSDSDNHFEPPFIDRQHQLSSQLLVSLAVLKSLFFLVLSFILGTAISAAFISRLTQRKIDADLDRQCATRMSQYSPVLKTINLKYSATVFNGSFMQETIYRRPGSPEVDLAWKVLGIECRLKHPGLYLSNKYTNIDNYEVWLRDRASVIPEEEGDASGLTKHHVQRAKKYGGGYFVNIEGLHHLHCLNIVRKSLYYNYEYYKAIGDYTFDNEEDISKFHVTHCLDTVRQVLMCNVDTGVLGQVWTRQSETKPPQAFPDFNTRHKCKNYDAVRMWAEANQVPSNEKLPVGYIAPPEEGDVLPFIP